MMNSAVDMFDKVNISASITMVRSIMCRSRNARPSRRARLQRISAMASRIQQATAAV